MSQAAELQRLGSCTRFLGNLDLHFESSVAIDLPRLRYAQNITVRGPGVDTLRLDALTRVDYLSVIATPNLAQMSMPHLGEATSLGFISTGSATTLALEAGIASLQSFVAKDTSLERVTGINAREIKTIDCERNLKLRGFPLPLLKHVQGSLAFKHTHPSFSLESPLLESVGGDLALNGGS